MIWPCVQKKSFEYIDVNNNVLITEELTDQEIAESVLQKENQEQMSQHYDDDETEPDKPLILEETYKCLKKLMNFFQHTQYSEHILSKINEIENNLEIQILNK
ncbi:unnamed protein product [Hermetia illucens]|uniref:Uncharacterized protein n=1 Tax=Hermetia illucens TaxID=343691 RepID=A0A7R8YYS0_HERIL|nr:unnamed protein product [Hermetia illucens]